MEKTQTNQHDAIQAVDFIPSELAPSRQKVPVWQIVVGTFAAIALLIFWFLFTSKSVRVDFSPRAEQVNVSGGLSFELGGVYLLREGNYVVRATTALHEPLEETLAVGSERNQQFQFNFTPLPGFLDLQVEPGDAMVEVDGKPIERSGQLELAAGQHELSVSHPRYLPNQQIVEIEGKQIVQSLSITLDPNWSEVSVMSAPAGAQVLVDGEPLGTTPGVVEALAGEREISVQLDGYKIHRQRIFAQAGIPIELDPVKLIQADAQLNITSAPAGAGVTVNGRFAGQTPITLDLKSGARHRVQVIRNGYDTFARTLNLERGSQESLHAKLKRLTGEVVVQVQPADATLSINGKPVGTANQVITLPIEPHDVSIALDGYAGYRQTITPKVGITQEIKVKLLTVEEARLAALKPTITTPGGQNLRLFEPFDFQMGASRREPGRRANETLRQVSMGRLFYLGTHEVTNAQFRQFASGHDSLSFNEMSLNDDAYPAANLSWHDAALYCNWLSEQEGLPTYYNVEFGKVISMNRNATGYRLPTEAEWSWAARTGMQPEGEQLRFPWGKSLPPPDRHGNYADRSAANLVGRIIFGYNDNYAVAAPTGTYKANVRGLFDLGGNVAEWTNDYYAIPGQEVTTDPQGPSAGEYYVIKGSSWMHGTITELRYSFRDYGVDARQDVGFRIARYAE